MFRSMKTTTTTTYFFIYDVVYPDFKSDVADLTAIVIFN